MEFNCRCTIVLHLPAGRIHSGAEPRWFSHALDERTRADESHEGDRRPVPLS
jgi:hypothetical protein